MPSLNDAFAELQAINTKLQTLHTDNSQLKTGQVAIQTAINAGTSATQAVQGAVEAGTVVLKAMVQEQHISNTLLLHLTRQADTMICALEAIARNTCGIHNEAHQQTALQRVMEASELALLDISKTVHPDAALDLARREGLRHATEACCPPPQEPPVCSYRPCPAPPPLKIKDKEGGKEDPKGGEKIK